ncbi:AMP-binding protein, partial [Noviherbaspirillum sp. Root189]|uniref:AMP-binding protein n=1 Tax=Noviherbaspirillum sp. Root189 TaxID=1736487 RepID=UPI000AC1022D
PPVVLAGLPEEAQLETVRTLVMAGEASNAALVRRFGHNRRLLNAYGPTETTVCATMHLCDAAEDAAPPIGRPIRNTRIYLLDAKGQPVPQGVAGEIHIGGVQVARGYLNRDELTAERFVADPFSSEPNARMYKTGDLGRYLADGSIQFLGRNDDQVKLRGFRIELGEIEAKLLEQDGVREAVVIAREDRAGDKRLVAYLTTDAQLDTEVLRAFLSATLPEYMVPAAYVQLDTLPLTPNGKLDRQALPAPEGDAYASHAYEAPQGEVETALAAIWAEVLGVEQVGRHDNFFTLGGHSLLAVKVASRMREAQLHVDVRTLFTAPDLAALSLAVASDMGKHEHAVEVPPNLIPSGCSAITPAMLTLVTLGEDDIARILQQVPGGATNVQDIYPLAPLQEGILFHHLMEREGDVYLSPTLFSFDSRARLDRFLQALQAVIDRHDILRTALHWEGLAEPVQVVWRSAPLQVEEPVLDAGQGDIADQLRRRYDPRHYRIDVRRAPLMGIAIAEDAANGRWLMLHLLHHLSIDHTTLDALLVEVRALMLSRGDTLPVPQPFRNFVAEARLEVGRAEHEAYFRAMLADVDEPTLPYGMSDAHGNGEAMREAQREVDADLSLRVRATARALNVSVASLCHVAWAQVLARLANRNDVVFGTVLFGRMQAGGSADRVLGMFINTLPVRVRLGEQTAAGSVQQTHAQLTQLLRHEHASLALAQRCSAVAAPAPLFTAILNYRYSTEPVVADDGEHGEPWEGIEHLGGEELSNYPLSLDIDDLGAGLRLNAQARTPVDPAQACELMHAALAQLVDALESTPNVPVASIDILPLAERKRLPVYWNAIDSTFPESSCVHELVEAHAAHSPNAPAVCFEGICLSYAELNARANRFARYLRSCGVGPDATVALCIDREPDMVMAMLAILKAGGAYLPLDPDYPAERLAYIIGHARPVAIVCGERAVARISGVVRTHNAPVIALGTDPTTWQQEDSADLPCATTGVAPHHLAYVIYTSGSTGEPKGVMVEHCSVANQVKALASRYRITASDRVLQFASISFDASVEEIFCTLLSGATLVLRSDAWLASAQVFWQLCEANRISVADLPTRFWQQLATDTT